MEIEIIDIPPGEAPEDVRARWVGLRLPLLVDGEREFKTVGVLSGPKTWFGVLITYLFGKTVKEFGYAVSSKAAIEILEKSSPEAASWWKNNTTYYDGKGGVFVFHSHVCQKRKKITNCSN